MTVRSTRTGRRSDAWPPSSDSTTFGPDHERIRSRMKPTVPAHAPAAHMPTESGARSRLTPWRMRSAARPPGTGRLPSWLCGFGSVTRSHERQVQVLCLPPDGYVSRVPVADHHGQGGALAVER